MRVARSRGVKFVSFVNEIRGGRYWEPDEEINNRTAAAEALEDVAEAAGFDDGDAYNNACANEPELARARIKSMKYRAQEAE